MKNILILLGILVVFAVIIGGVFGYVNKRFAEKLNQYENDNIKLLERIDAGDRQVDQLKADTTELKKIIRTKTGEQQTTDRQIELLKQREKKYINESNTVLRYTDGRMDSIYRARYPVPDSLRQLRTTPN